MRKSTLENIGELFWPRVKKGRGCWIWTGAIRTGGYGNVRLEGKNRGAHVVSLLLAGTKIKKGVWVLHRCDNPPCVNPRHLFTGSRRDNVRDSVLKSRWYLSKLTPKMVNEIRTKYVKRRGILDELSKKYKVGKDSIRNVVSRKTWSYV